jgi:hypothetical protein
MENTSRSIIFKIKLEDDLRRWTCDETSLSYDTVLDRVTSLFSIAHDTAMIKYLDDEGDWVTMACDDDLSEAISIAAQSSNRILIRLDVTVMPANRVNKAGDEVTKVALDFLHQEALPFLHQEALPKVVQGLTHTVNTLTPRGMDNTQAHEWVAAAHSLVQDVLPPLTTSVHQNIVCDNCEMGPIVGIRYKMKGKDFDLCESCIQGRDDMHLFHRIVHPGNWAVDMNANDELSSRFGWSADTAKLVAESHFATTVEAIRHKIPTEQFQEMAAMLEPIFAVPQEFLSHVLQAVEPTVAALLQDPTTLHDLPEKLRDIIAEPALLLDVTFPPAPAPAPVEHEHFPIMMNIAGSYECHLYDETEHKNDWHRVTITCEQGTHFMWRNVAGVAWSLHPTADVHVYRVGEDCPYFKDGYNEMNITITEGGCVGQVLGPHLEPYIVCDESQDKVHAGIWCDGCKMKPILGNRYWKRTEHDTFDVCQACYDQLNDEQKGELSSIILEDTAPVEEAKEYTLEMGPIWGQEHAQRVGAEYNAAHPGHQWTGHWWTTVPKEMSVIVVRVEPGYQVDEAWRPAVIEEDPEAQANEVSEQQEQNQSPTYTLQDALTDMGIGHQQDLSASMIAGIELAIQENSANAMQAAIEESKAEAEAAELARAEAEAKARAEAEAAELARAEAEAETDAASEEVDQLVAMGFERDAATKAIETTNKNLEDAVNLLLTQTNFQTDFQTNFQDQPAEDDLGAVSDDSTVWTEEWDTLLEDLEEMGFDDQETNRRILTDVNGDVKRAVAELVSLERQGWQ